MEPTTSTNKCFAFGKAVMKFRVWEEPERRFPLLESAFASLFARDDEEQPGLVVGAYEEVTVFAQKHYSVDTLALH